MTRLRKDLMTVRAQIDCQDFKLYGIDKCRDCKAPCGPGQEYRERVLELNRVQQAEREKDDDKMDAVIEQIKGFGRWLADAVKENRLQPEELDEEAGIRRGTVKSIITSRQDGRPITQRKIMDALGADVDLVWDWLEAHPEEPKKRGRKPKKDAAETQQPKEPAAKTQQPKPTVKAMDFRMVNAEKKPTLRVTAVTGETARYERVEDDLIITRGTEHFRIGMGEIAALAEELLATAEWFR